ncbi:MAG: hypothetical protein HOP02_11350 [Methylococcaceae bacterium]|nr:hypothetical protein [Methylococcaceae bacterium]
MSFKSLNLKQDLISQALKDYHESITIRETKKEKFIEYEIELPDQNMALLQVYYNKDGTSTLSYKVGKNQSLSLEIAEYLKEKCTVGGNITKPSLSINEVTDDKFLLILDFLKEECSASVSEPIVIQHGTQYKVTGKQGDTLTFNLFNTKKLQIQGKPLLLYSETIGILSELFDYKDLIEAQLKVVQVDITVAEVVTELQVLMPNAYDFIGDKLVSIISPALALRKLAIELSDYSCFTFPALRGLEGYVKLLFVHKIGMTIGRDGFGEYFQNNLELKSTIKSKHDLKICHAIENSYQYYRSQRHGLFHADTPIETTRIISNKRDADKIIENVTQIIEETYTSTIK